MRARTVLPPAAAGLGRSQHGLSTTAQLVACGLSPKAIASLTRQGVLERLEQNVYRFAAAQETFEQRAMRAVLAVGAPVAVSHGTGARLWGFEQLGGGPIEVTVPADRHPRRTCATVHRCALAAHDVALRSGIPVTAPPRLLADLVLQPYGTQLLGRLLDHLFRHRMLSPRELLASLDRLQWHPGIAALRRVVDRQLEGVDIGGRVPDNSWERAVARAAAAVGLAPPVPQFPVALDHRMVWIDVAIPSLMLAIEFDGYDTHRLREAFDNDRRRADDLTSAGWRVLQISSAMSEAEIERRVGRAIEQQRRRLGVA